MKIYKKIAVSALILLFLLAAVRFVCDSFFLPYEVPFLKDDIASVSFYYDNLAQKKSVTAISDLSLLFDSLNKVAPRGNYYGVPAGGQTFYLVFHLADGIDWTCAYYQSASDFGYYSDGTVKIKVSGLDLKTLWGQLPYQEHAASIEQELTSFPPL